MSWKVIKSSTPLGDTGDYMQSLYIAKGDKPICYFEDTDEEAEKEAAVIVNALNAQERKVVQKGTVLIATHECSGGLTIGKEYEVIDLNDSVLVVKSEITNSHHFYLDENESAYWGNYFKLKENKPEVPEEFKKQVLDHLVERGDVVPVIRTDIKPEVMPDELKRIESILIKYGYGDFVGCNPQSDLIKAIIEISQQQYNGLPTEDEMLDLLAAYHKETDNSKTIVEKGLIQIRYANKLRSIAQQQIQVRDNLIEMASNIISDCRYYMGANLVNGEFEKFEEAKQLLNK